MFNSNPSIISKIISHQMFRQLCHLWQQTMMTSEGDKVFISEQDLLSHNDAHKNQFNLINFKLIITDDLLALLLVETKISDLHYQISIVFSYEVIVNFANQISPQLTSQIKQKLDLALNKTKSSSTLQEEFMLNILNILTENLASSENFSENLIDGKPIDLILQNRIEQEKILQKVTHQIQQNLDLLVIVKMTIEQVQHLLEIDRLVVYQLNVLSKVNNSEENELKNIVTFEARATEIIPSILNLNEDVCFTNINESEAKYSQGFTLVINDVINSNLDSCLKYLMQKICVKAKVVIPIIVKGNLWGLLIAHQCFSTREWKQNEIEFLRHISEYLAVAIYQSNSYQQLQQQKEILEQEVEQRAKQLQDALLAAQVANQSKTEFLGNISHELRTPLTCVIGLSGTLLHWSKDSHNLPLDKQTRYLEIIQDSGRKLLELINNTLDFADLEAGKSLLKIQAFSLQELGKKVWRNSLPIAKTKGIKLIFDYQVKLENNLFFADEERLTQILLILIDNGIKFTASGGEVILRIWKENNQAIFQVEDTGIGIYKDQFSLLFKKFQQLENYRTRTHGGTGLGLALTKRLVELHGGRIEVESEVAKGSIFTVFIPDSNKVKLPTISENKEIYNTINKTIVIISKDEEVATFICELLTAAEYQIIWLFDYIDAISKIKVLEPNLVILQQELTDIYKISDAIKYLKEKHTIKFMFIHQEMNGNEWEKLSLNGIDDYLLQPLQPTLLLTKIRHLI